MTNNTWDNIKFGAAILIMLVVGYLVVSFIEWEINPFHWLYIWRVIYAVYVVAILCAGVSVLADYDKEIKNQSPTP